LLITDIGVSAHLCLLLQTIIIFTGKREPIGGWFFPSVTFNPDEWKSLTKLLSVCRDFSTVPEFCRKPRLLAFKIFLGL
jgi:hypothetical protein